jgi:lipopolysaccharide transport system permease protein
VLDYRWFLPALALRAVRRRYRRTILGWPWLVIRPLSGALAGALLFAGVLGVQTGRVPYLLFFAVGSAAWSLVSVGLLWCTRSLEVNRRLLRTAYFPRLLLPVSHLAPALLEFAIFFLVAVAVGIYYAAVGEYPLPPPTDLLYLPVAVLYGCLLVLALGLWTSVLGARNRDLRFSLGYVTQAWMFVTPVIYPLTAVPGAWRFVVTCNPATLLVVLLRQAMLGTHELEPAMAVSGLVALLPLLLGGFWFFTRAPITSLDEV